MHLVLIETSGNQDYIFGSNKLRQNVGASELVWRVGNFARRMVSRDAVERPLDVYDGQLVVRGERHPLPKHDWLGNLEGVEGAVELIQEIEQFASTLGERDCQVLVGASGKALIRVPDIECARALIRAVTLWARIQAPGLEVHGVAKEETADSRRDYQVLVNAIHELHSTMRASIPPEVGRFQRMPCVADCRTTSFAASALVLSDGAGGSPHEPMSAVAIAKRAAAPAGLRRLRQAAEEAGVTLAESMADLDAMESVEWLAVIHADGNGLGQTFRDFARCSGSTTVDEYSQRMRAFSDSLDEIASRAFARAAKAADHQWRQIVQREPQAGRPIRQSVPIVPLVLGGDDLTLVCDGRLAIRITQTYLSEFERLSRQSPVISAVAARRNDYPYPWLSAAAGVAIVKPHFPFYAAYALAEQLLRRAKSVKRAGGRIPVSAFDFHVLRDASGADLDRITDQLATRAARLFHRPVVITDLADIRDHASTATVQWVESHHVIRLNECVGQLNKVDPEDGQRRYLPNSLMHELRGSLFLGKEHSDKKLRLAAQTWSEAGFCEAFQPFLPRGASRQNASLFFDDQNVPTTRLLDAMEIAPFWPMADLPTVEGAQS